MQSIREICICMLVYIYENEALKKFVAIIHISSVHPRVSISYISFAMLVVAVVGDGGLDG